MGVWQHGPAASWGGHPQFHTGSTACLRPGHTGETAERLRQRGWAVGQTQTWAARYTDECFHLSKQIEILPLYLAIEQAEWPTSLLFSNVLKCIDLLCMYCWVAIKNLSSTCKLNSTVMRRAHRIFLHIPLRFLVTLSLFLN